MPDFRPITPHIWRLTLDWDLKIPFYPPIPVAVWLVKEADEWTLIDAGHPLNVSQVLKAIIDFLGSARPSRLILTHAHIDHGGAMAEVCQRWSLPIWAHRLEIEFINGVKRYRDIVSSTWLYNVAKPFLAEMAWHQTVARTLYEGERIGEMEVIHVPGHTPGMIALHHRADRAIIAADSFMNLNQKLSPPMPLSTPEPIEAQRSMQKLAALDFDTLLPSHDSSEKGVPAEVVRRLANAR